MHTIKNPRKIVANPHNRVGIIEYIIHYISNSNSLTCPLGQIQMPHRVTRVNSTNVLNEGLRIGEIGRRMNSKVKLVETGVYRK
jgi:hypothetical protein